MNVYGYWVSADEVYEVPHCEHWETARKIIRNLYGEEGWQKVRNSSHSVYRFMFTLGFMRIVNERYGDEYGVQYRNGTKLSKLQKDFLKDATRIDRMDDPQECETYSIMM